MDKQKQIAKVAETEDDRILFARIYDRLTGAEQKNIPACTCFLSPREQVLTKRLLPHLQLHFFGGPPDAERAMCCWLPDYLEEDWLSGADSPVAAVRAVFFEKDKLTHRDFLGSLMGCGIKRETVGDIYVAEGSCDFLVTREILPNLTVKEIRDTVSSLRLDSIVGSGFGMARGKASALIETGKVALNDLPCLKPDKLLTEGDKVSARGFGKLILTQVGGRTKKDRISIMIEKYQ